MRVTKVKPDTSPEDRFWRPGEENVLYCRCGWYTPIQGDQFRVTLQEDLPHCPKQRWWNWPLHRTMVHYKPWEPPTPGTYITAWTGDPDLDHKRAMHSLDLGISAISPLRPAINELVRQQYLKDLRPAPDLLSPEVDAGMGPDDGGDK